MDGHNEKIRTKIDANECSNGMQKKGDVLNKLKIEEKENKD